MMAELDVHSVLVAARNLLDREGWVQGSWYTPGVGRCVNGAIGGAATSCRHFEEAILEVAKAVGLEANVMSPIEWNNAPGRTKAEVLAAFDRAIAATAPAPPDPTFSELTEASELLDRKAVMF